MDDVDTFSAEEKAFHESRGAVGLPEATDAPVVEQKEPDKPAAEAEKPKDEDAEVMKLVPLSAVEAIRAEKRALKEELAAKLAEHEREKQEWQAKLKPQAEQPKTGVDLARKWTDEDIEKDPIGHIKWQNAVRAAADAAKSQEAERSEAQKRVATIGQRHAQAFAAKQADYFDSTGPDGKPVTGAYNFLRAKAAESLQIKNPNASVEEVAKLLDIHELNEIQMAARDGVNVAERFYQMALENGYAAPQKAEVKTGPTEAERIAELEKAQKASKSLGSVPAGGGEPELSAKALADMSDEEFAKMPAAQRRKLMGG
jgi:hypothetical protein